MTEQGTYTYHAEYEDADDVRGTVKASQIGDAVSATADDLFRQVGESAIDYGTLRKVTITCEDEGIEMVITPERKGTMQTIYKYFIEIADEQVVTMPEGADILSVGKQEGQAGLQLWALVDSEAAMEERHVLIKGTGHPADNIDPDVHFFVGTVIDGLFVWHVFVDESEVVGYHE